MNSRRRDQSWPTEVLGRQATLAAMASVSVFLNWSSKVENLE